MTRVWIQAMLFLSAVRCSYSKENGAYAQGNLAVTFKAKSAKSGDDHPQKSEVTSLWCQARSHETNKLLAIKKAYFVRQSNQEIIQAVVNGTRAVLPLGTITVKESGIYRCDITTVDNNHAWGWLFVNMRPVFHTNISKVLETSEDNRFHIISSSIKASEGDTITLTCPVVGYPIPTIKWLKDGEPLASTEQITFLETALQISKVKFDDEGIYSCIARNKFLESVDTSPREFESRLDQKLRIRSSYRWIYPLLTIIIILLLLFLIIYLCTAFNRFKTYNVERNEKRKNVKNEKLKGERESVEQPILSYDKNEISS